MSKPETAEDRRRADPIGRHTHTRTTLHRMSRNAATKHRRMASRYFLSSLSLAKHAPALSKPVIRIVVDLKKGGFKVDRELGSVDGRRASIV